MIGREVADLFLGNYEMSLVNLKRQAQTYEKNLQKQVDPRSKTAKTLQRLLSEKYSAIDEYEEAIEKIKNSLESQVEILFPPIAKIKDMGVEQIKAFSSLLASKPNKKAEAGDIGLQLYKNIKILNKLHALLLECDWSRFYTIILVGSIGFSSSDG
jgi:tetratricopeptide (TPR) repeat protein